MNKTCLAIASGCAIIAVLSPIAVYAYFNIVIESYKVQISRSMKENQELEEKIKEFMKPYDPYLMEPYLVTTLGWYLHDSSDIFPESRNSLTIYGQVLNVGALNATNCKLVVNFYSNNTVVQESEIDLGTIRYWGYKYIREEIDCRLANSVTGIEVTRKWS